MNILTQNLNYTTLTNNHSRISTGGDSDFTREEWDKIGNFDGRFLIILKKDTSEPVAAVKYSPSRITAGKLYAKIKSGLLLQEPLTNEENANISGLAGGLSKYNFATWKTEKLNWTLQILDENFGIRVKVEKQNNGYHFHRKL